MTALLTKAFEELGRLPHDRQDGIAKMLLEWAAHHDSETSLSDTQAMEVRRRLAEPADHLSEEDAALAVAQLTRSAS